MPAERPTNPQQTAAPPVDHALETARNRILALVHLWMSLWDRNSGDGAPLADLLSPQGFTVQLNGDRSGILTKIADVQAWYAGIARQVRQVNHIVESVEISALPSGSWSVHVQVRAPGIDAGGVPFSVRSDHRWEVVDYGGFLPRIAGIEVSVSAT